LHYIPNDIDIKEFNGWIIDTSNNYIIELYPRLNEIERMRALYRIIYHDREELFDQLTTKYPLTIKQLSDLHEAGLSYWFGGLTHKYVKAELTEEHPGHRWAWDKHKVLYRKIKKILWRKHGIPSSHVDDIFIENERLYNVMSKKRTNLEYDTYHGQSVMM